MAPDGREATTGYHRPVSPDEPVASDDADDRLEHDAETDDLDGILDEDALTNGRLARIFHDIGDMLELNGELVFKTVAYHRPADAIGRSPFDVAGAYRAGDRPQIPGVGKAIDDKIAELVET